MMFTASGVAVGVRSALPTCPHAGQVYTPAEPTTGLLSRFPLYQARCRTLPTWCCRRSRSVNPAHTPGTSGWLTANTKQSRRHGQATHNAFVTSAGSPRAGNHPASGKSRQTASRCQAGRCSPAGTVADREG
jgi:hypothetical protein